MQGKLDGPTKQVAGTNRFRRALALTTIYLVASATVLFVFLVRPGLSGHPRADFPQQVNGTAYRPYVGRPLVATTVRFAKCLVPDRLEESLSDGLAGRRMVELLGWDRDSLADYAIASAVLLMYFLALAFVLRALARRFYPFPEVLHNVSPLFGLLFLPLFFSYYSYLYDVGTLLTSSLCVLALTTRRFSVLVAAFALAAVNKETSIVLIPLCGVHRRLETGRWSVWPVVGLVAVWASIRLALGAVYGGNPGTFLEWHFDHTLWLFTELPLRLVASLGACLAMGLFVSHRWRSKPRILRIGLIATFLPLFCASLFFGYADELRGYYESFPFIYLLMLPSVYALLGFDYARYSADAGS